MISDTNAINDESATIKYALYLEEPPDDTTIQGYVKHLAQFVEHDEVQKLHLELAEKFRGLQGRYKFNQDIEDEWLIIYMLYELSKFDEKLVIRVIDGYGDPILIEAADHLPQWLESRKSRFRCFIHKGAVHIIPESIDLKLLAVPDRESCSIKEKAANFVRQANRQPSDSLNSLYQGEPIEELSTIASFKIQRAIMDQLSGLPDKRAWLSRMFKQLDEIITDRGGTSGGIDSDRLEQVEQELENNFKENLSLASIKAMADRDLDISPISSITSPKGSPRPSLSSSSSSSWLSEQEDS